MNLCRVLEMAYLYAWGVDGNSDLRDEWKRAYEELTPSMSMMYLGDGKFEWRKSR
jgi:hypothetical protein